MFKRLLVADDLTIALPLLVRCIPRERLGVEEVIVCHAVNPPEGIQLSQDQLGRIRKQLEERAGELKAQGFNCRIELAKGSPGRTVLELAEKYNVSMIIIGSHIGVG